MKTVFLIFFLVVSLSSSAQKIRFSDQSNQWITLGFKSDNQPFQNTFSYGTDTLAFGVIYKYIHNKSIDYHCSNFWGSCTGGSGNSSATYLVREDTVNGLVYFRNISTASTDLAEHVLYNYNLHIGDSLTFNGITDTVASIDSIVINGVYHTIYNFRSTLPMRSYSVLEGIGCTNSPVFPFTFGSCFEYGESLFCFSQNGVRPAVQAPINSCATFTTICCTSLSGNVFDNVSGCSSMLSSENTTLPPPTISITPNPVYEYIKIDATRLFTTNTFISVHDITGKCVFRSQIESQSELTINTASWNSGLYIVIIQNNKGIIKEKIQIHH